MMIVISSEVPFVSDHKLCLSNKGVRYSDCRNFSEGKGLTENSICVHALTVWILHYLFQQVNLRADQSITYRDDIDLPGGIASSTMPALPSCPSGGGECLFLTSWNTHYKYLSLQPKLILVSPLSSFKKRNKNHSPLILWGWRKDILPATVSLASHLEM